MMVAKRRDTKLCKVVEISLADSRRQNICPTQVICSRRAILCSDLAQQRHDIIRNRVALVCEESVSVVTGGTRRLNQENPTHAHLHHW